MSERLSPYTRIHQSIAWLFIYFEPWGNRRQNSPPPFRPVLIKAKNGWDETEYLGIVTRTVELGDATCKAYMKCLVPHGVLSPRCRWLLNYAERGRWILRVITRSRTTATQDRSELPAKRGIHGAINERVDGRAEGEQERRNERHFVGRVAQDYPGQQHDAERRDPAQREAQDERR